MMWFLIAFAFLVGMVLAYTVASSELEEIARFHLRIKEENGWTAYRRIGRYCLMSFDEGVNWHLVEKQNHLGGRPNIKVLGPVGQVAPGLMEHIEALRELRRLVLDKGVLMPPALKRERAKELLERAGFFFRGEEDDELPEHFWENLAGLMEGGPINTREDSFREAEELLERAGFFFNEEANLTPELARQWIEDPTNWSSYWERGD